MLTKPKKLRKLLQIEGPVYLRFGRPDWPVFLENQPFEIGKGLVLKEGKDLSIFATGHMVWQALEACRELENKESIANSSTFIQ